MPESVRPRVTGLLKSAYEEREKGNEKGAGKIYQTVARIYLSAYKESKASGALIREYLQEAQRWNLEANSLLGNLRPPLEERLEDVPLFTPEPVKETIDLTYVKGLKETKEQLLNTVAMRVLNLLEKPNGVLLYGPPGTGKTLLARGTAGECTKALADEGYEVYFFNIDRAEIQSHLFGVTEKNLKSAFDTAKKYATKPKSISILFFDELHGLISSSGTEKTELSERIAATFYTLLDGLKGRGNILPMGATNYPTKLPGPLLRGDRFGVSILIPPPDVDALEAMFEGYQKEFPAFVFNIDLRQLAMLAKEKELSGADVKSLFENAVTGKMQELRGSATGNKSLVEVIEEMKRRQPQLKTAPITTAEFVTAIAGARSSLPLWYAEMDAELRTKPEEYRRYFRELDEMIEKYKQKQTRISIGVNKHKTPTMQTRADTPASKVPTQDSLQEEILKKRDEVEKEK